MTIFPIIGFFTLLGLIYAKHTEQKNLEWVFKPATSLLFVLAGLTAGGEGNYATLIIIGLILGAVGDVLLIKTDKNWFLAGLIVFLLGHLLYVVAFHEITPLTRLNLLWVILLLVIAAGVFFFLRPHLGEMQVPVVVYMLVITAMVLGALAVYFESDHSPEFRRLVALGAICFYLSDLAVALDQFVKPTLKNFYWGLPLYYAGQFMLALSLGFL